MHGGGKIGKQQTFQIVARPTAHSGQVHPDEPRIIFVLHAGITAEGADVRLDMLARDKFLLDDASHQCPTDATAHFAGVPIFAVKIAGEPVRFNRTTTGAGVLQKAGGTALDLFGSARHQAFRLFGINFHPVVSDLAVKEFR